MSAPDQPQDAPTDTTAKTVKTKAINTAPPSPSVGGGVQFVLNGEAESIGEHRPAVIVAFDGETLDLQVFTLSRDGARYANGQYEALAVPHDEDTKAPGTWHWPE